MSRPLSFYPPQATLVVGEWLTVRTAGGQLGLAALNLPERLTGGFIPREQIMPGTQWRTQKDQKRRESIVAGVLPAHASRQDIFCILGVPGRTTMQRVKRGEPFPTQVKRDH